MCKKVICIFIAVILMLSPISAIAFEEEISFENPEGNDESGVLIEETGNKNPADDIVLKNMLGAAQAPRSGACGEHVSWEYTDGELIISGTGKMDDYNYFYVPWQVFRENINTVTVKNGVTYIGGYAFESCYDLVNITIPESVTEIGYLAFHNCESLEEITIPKSITSIGNYAFDYCTSLRYIHYSGSKEDWDKIAFGLGVKESVACVTMHYNIKMPGDMDGDGSLTNRDVKMLFEYITKIISYDDLSVMDINSDGAINNRDVILLFNVASQTF